MKSITEGNVKAMCKSLKFFISFSIEIIREITQFELQKAQIWGPYTEMVKDILGWYAWENEAEFQSYTERVQATYNVFSHPMTDNF